MKQFVRRFLPKSQRQLIGAQKTFYSSVRYHPAIKKLIKWFSQSLSLILLVRERLVRYGINKLPIESKVRILNDMAFTRNAKFHPEIQCSITNEIENWRSQKTLSNEMLEWINEFKRDDIFYDIGANIGMFSLFAAKFWHGNVKVIAFEPSFSTFASLMKNVAINHLEDTVSCFQVALGASTRLGQFNYTNLEAGAALHTFDTLKNYRRDTFVPIFQQPMLCYALSDFVKNFDLPLPTHIKLDVDGTELEVLRGAESILKNSKTQSLMIEIVDISENDERTMSIVNFLNQLGYKCQERFLHSTNLNFPRISDYYFVRL